jgi:hypothetical protein
VRAVPVDGQDTSQELTGEGRPRLLEETLHELQEPDQVGEPDRQTPPNIPADMGVWKHSRVVADAAKASEKNSTSWSKKRPQLETQALPIATSHTCRT